MRGTGGAFDGHPTSVRVAAAAAGIALAVLAPIVLWGAVARGTVANDLATREASRRLLAAQLAGART